MTKAEKQSREDKERLADEIRASLDKYQYVWILRVDNMRNTFLKTIRQDWKGSKITFGKTKMMQKIFGRTVEEEYLPNLHEISKFIVGEVGLLFTDEEPKVVQEYFDSFVKVDYARAGTVSPIDFVLPAGIVYSRGGQIPVEDDVPLAHSLESTVRQLGVPSSLKAGKVVISNEYQVVKAGQTLNSNQTRLLKLFGVACAEFKVTLVAYYDKQSSSVVNL